MSARREQWAEAWLSLAPFFRDARAAPLRQPGPFVRVTGQDACPGFRHNAPSEAVGTPLGGKRRGLVCALSGACSRRRAIDTKKTLTLRACALPTHAVLPPALAAHSGSGVLGGGPVSCGMLSGGCNGTACFPCSWQGMGGGTWGMHRVVRSCSRSFDPHLPTTTKYADAASWAWPSRPWPAPGGLPYLCRAWACCPRRACAWTWPR